MTLTASKPSDGADAPVSPPSRRKGWFAALMLRIHFYAGILVGPFILIAALSGALYALSPQIERVVYADVLTAPVSESTLSLEDQISAADAYIGADAAITAVRPAPEAGATTRVMYAQEGLGASESRAVFVDPATAEIRGDLVVYGTSGSLPMRTWISNLHRSLHLGDVGRLYSETAASWLGIIALAGFALWIVRIRKSRAKKDFVRPNTKHRGYRGIFTWHTSVGIWVLLGALFLAATGITWSQHAGGNVSELRAALNWSTPAVNTDLTGEAADADEHAHHHGPSTAPTGDANPATFDAVLAIAQRENVNTGEVEIQPPAEQGKAWMIREIKRSAPTELDSIAIDGTSMQVVDRVDFADYSLAAKLAGWGVSLHMGLLFGLFSQIALFVVAIAIAAMVVFGYLMWWKRRPRREPRPLMGTPPRRGALRDAPWWGVAAVIAGAAVLGAFLPLVGWTLVGFVVTDVLLGWRAARRA